MHQREAKMPDTALGIELLLDGPYPTLWDNRCRRETLRFLRKRGADLSRSERSRLLHRIMEGPAREEYSNVITEEEWTEIRDHQVRLHLYKLVESGMSLPLYARREYDRIQNDLPWEPPTDHSEEFPYFVSSGTWADDRQGEIEDFGSMSAEAFVQWAESQTDVPWMCGGGWYFFVENEIERSVELLTGAAVREKWPLHPWHAIVSKDPQSGGTSKAITRTIAALLLRMPVETLSVLGVPAARWLESARDSLPKRLRQDLWRNMWAASVSAGEPDGELNFDRTLNHAGGILGKVVYDEMASYISHVAPREHPGLPRPLRADFEMIAESDGASARLARVRLAPLLYILNRVDPDWTRRALLDRMDPDQSETFEPFLWEGFLWNPKWSEDLLQSIKELFFKMLRNLEKIPQPVRRRGPELFIYMAIPPDRMIETSESKDVLYSMKASDLANAAWVLRSMLEAAGNKALALWRETIGPWFDEAWPKQPAARSSELSQNLAWMAIDADEAFPEIVEKIADIMLPEEHHSALFHLQSKNEESDLIGRHPKSALTLTGKLVGSDIRHAGAMVKEILDTISAADSGLSTDSEFHRLQVLVE